MTVAAGYKKRPSTATSVIRVKDVNASQSECAEVRSPDCPGSYRRVERIAWSQQTRVLSYLNRRVSPGDRPSIPSSRWKHTVPCDIHDHCHTLVKSTRGASKSIGPSLDSKTIVLPDCRFPAGMLRCLWDGDETPSDPGSIDSFSIMLAVPAPVPVPYGTRATMHLSCISINLHAKPAVGGLTWMTIQRHRSDSPSLPAAPAQHHLHTSLQKSEEFFTYRHFRTTL
ncbi:GL22421 [Drosophila persimilis]|uniref:GL22421 n=1 Tax=Drosophila persimilis TaxID=7234 RepID=B4HA15_DROPE|nr:GL22421 [Drosophila persimilis]